jgi:hypothetical protein
MFPRCVLRHCVGPTGLVALCSQGVFSACASMCSKGLFPRCVSSMWVGPAMVSYKPWHPCPPTGLGGRVFPKCVLSLCRAEFPMCVLSLCAGPGLAAYRPWQLCPPTSLGGHVFPSALCLFLSGSVILKPLWRLFILAPPRVPDLASGQTLKDQPLQISSTVVPLKLW